MRPTSIRLSFIGSSCHVSATFSPLQQLPPFESTTLTSHVEYMDSIQAKPTPVLNL